MSTTKEFDTLKRKVYLAYHQDGILDLVAGSVVLGFGTFMLTDNIAFLMAGWFVMTMYVFLKNRITIPRFGYVRIDSQKKPVFIHKYTGWSRIAFFKEIFPEARFVHVIRDGRAVAACADAPGLKDAATMMTVARLSPVLSNAFNVGDTPPCCQVS